MVSDDVTDCPNCGGRLYFYRTVKRRVKTEYGKATYVYISGMRCAVCQKEHRALPACVIPYKHYHADIVQGFATGLYSSDDLRFEDYPSESTIRRWRNELAHSP